MVFSSIIFLFYFLPLTVLAYLLAPHRFRNAILLMASLIFYIWGSGALTLVLISSIVGNYFLGATVWRTADRPHIQKRWFVSAIVFNLLLLGSFKYANFFAEQINILAGSMSLPPLAWSTIVLPIGISFFTFQAMSYIIDLRRKEAAPAVSLADFALYVSMFPQLVAGPIVRYSDIAAALSQRETRWQDIEEGSQRFALGLFKKVVIADTIAPVADAAFAAPPGSMTASAAWLGLVAYTLQIYFDFSGYSDMAVGLGRIFGFRFPENFNRPYSAQTMTDFWRRWHISLSTWFRDYVYIPLGGNRASETRTWVNLGIVFLLTGFWHGANWTFIAWGIWHGIILGLERATGIRERIRNGSTVHFIARAVTLVFVMLGWVLFRSDSIDHAGQYFLALFTPGAQDIPFGIAAAFDTRAMITMVLACVVFVLPGDFNLRNLITAPTPLGMIARWGVIGIGYPLALMAVISGSFSAFIYFQF